MFFLLRRRLGHSKGFTLRRETLLLALVLMVSFSSYGFLLWKEAQAGVEYRQMIREISMAMADSPGCME